MDPIFLLLFWLMSNGKKPDATTSTTTTEPGKQIPIVGPAVGPASNLEKRARQKRAQDWIPLLIKAGVPVQLAEGVARWIGIESSGNPLALSPIGERGLLQATKTVGLKGKLFTPAEWERMQSPATSREEHARLAAHQLKYHLKAARRWVANPPADLSPDWLLYAKMHHTRPLDLKEAKPHGPALPMARDLQGRWSGDSQRRQRLAMATVVAFNKATL